MYVSLYSLKPSYHLEFNRLKSHALCLYSWTYENLPRELESRAYFEHERCTK